MPTSRATRRSEKRADSRASPSRSRGTGSVGTIEPEVTDDRAWRGRGGGRPKAPASPGRSTRSDPAPNAGSVAAARGTRLATTPRCRDLARRRRARQPRRSTPRPDARFPRPWETGSWDYVESPAGAWISAVRRGACRYASTGSSHVVVTAALGNCTNFTSVMYYGNSLVASPSLSSDFAGRFAPAHPVMAE